MTTENLRIILGSQFFIKKLVVLLTCCLVDFFSYLCTRILLRF